ncbi:MAG TPA: DUF6159 family protein [Jatrophihabitantaceae bacterium]|nr:DUF6159 family protein [Jatrophihabitantaceae bacterium]
MTQPHDPYGYLPFPDAQPMVPPPPPPPGAPPQPQLWSPYSPHQGQLRRGWTGRATGKQILSASWNLLQKERAMMALPLMSIACALLAGLALFGPGWALGRAIGHTNSAAIWAGGVLAVLGLTTVSIFFQAALVIGANMQADGYHPTMSTVLGAAWQRRGEIIAWAVVSTTVGLAIRAIEQRFGALGRILGIVAGIAWAIATYLAVPVIVAERVGPFEAVRRSGELIRQIWGTGLRSTLRFGLIQFVLLLVPFFMIICGVITISSGGGLAAIGVLIVLAGIVVLIAMSSVFAAVSTYAQTMIYRYAVGQPIPIPVELMGGAFRPRRG